MKKFIVSTLTLAVLFAPAASVFAQNTSTSTATSTPSAKTVAKMQAAKIKADKEIDRRIASLSKLIARIQEFKKIPDAQKSQLASELESHSSALSQLKAKIDADTDLETLKADVKSITGAYRVYALLIPRDQIIAAIDRLDTIAGELVSAAEKLNTRIGEAKAAGKNTSSLETALADMHAKIDSAVKDYQNAVGAIAPLVPDLGDKTVMASNKKALENARKLVQSARKSLGDAQKDGRKIQKGLKTLAKGSGNATSTATTTAH